MGVGGDSARFGCEGYLLHLDSGEVGMVVDAALGEEGNIFEAIVVLDNVVKVGVTFAANVLKRLDVDAKLGGVLGSAFGIDLAVFHDRLEPGEIFAVMRDDNLKVLGVPCCRGGSPGRE